MQTKDEIDVRFAAFDIETERLFRKDENAGDVSIPLVTVVLCTSTCRFVWRPPADQPHLSEQDVCDIIDTLEHIAKTHTLVTWSGTNSDWPLLMAACGGSTDHIQTCCRLACFSVDIPLLVLAHKGFMIGLAACSKGMELFSPKPIESATSPEMWARGDRDKVIALCTSDAQNTLDIANRVEESGMITWKTKRGKMKTLVLQGRLSTSLAFQCPFVRPLPTWRWALPITPTTCFAWVRPHMTGFNLPLTDVFASIPTWKEWHEQESDAASSSPVSSPEVKRSGARATETGVQRIVLAMTPIVVPHTLPTSPIEVVQTTLCGEEVLSVNEPPQKKKRVHPPSRHEPVLVAPVPRRVGRALLEPLVAVQKGRLFAAAIADIV